MPAASKFPAKFPGDKISNYIRAMPPKKRISVPGAIAHIMSRVSMGSGFFPMTSHGGIFSGCLLRG
jgi:hypothetical protein